MCTICVLNGGVACVFYSFHGCIFVRIYIGSRQQSTYKEMQALEEAHARSVKETWKKIVSLSPYTNPYIHKYGYTLVTLHLPANCRLLHLEEFIW